MQGPGPVTMSLHPHSAEDIQLYHDPKYGDKPRFYKYKNFTMPYYTKDTIKEVRIFEVRERDIFVASFPKSGN